MAKIKKLTKEQIAQINPFGYQHHYMTTSDWIQQCFEIQCDSKNKPIILPGCKIFNEEGKLIQQFKYKVKRKAELWMIALVIIMDLEMSVRTKDALNKKKVSDFAFYGSYNRIREKILASVDSRLVPQLSRTITLRSISTAMKRAEKSGFVNIEYDYSVTRKTCSKDENYRRITINYDKLMELSEFNLDKRTRSYTWKKYHRCSREHRWLAKRPVSYLKPLIEDLADKNKKEEFRQKLQGLKLKLKNYQDVFKAFIISKQKMYKTNELKNLTIEFLRTYGFKRTSCNKAEYLDIEVDRTVIVAECDINSWNEKIR